VSIAWQRRVAVRDESDVAVARLRTRELAVLEGLGEPEVEALVTAVSEVVRNMVVHAHGGEVLMGACVEEQRHCVVVCARDDGPGIADPEQALQDGFSSKASLGLGLPSARRLVDGFELESRKGHGTTVTLRKLGPRLA
jgi:serine/threonine-protein kinase RsbT